MDFGRLQFLHAGHLTSKALGKTSGVLFSRPGLLFYVGLWAYYTFWWSTPAGHISRLEKRESGFIQSRTSQCRLRYLNDHGSVPDAVGATCRTDAEAEWLKSNEFEVRKYRKYGYKEEEIARLVYGEYPEQGNGKMQPSPEHVSLPMFPFNLFK